MSKRSVFTTLTPLPAGISRATVMETLKNHVEMIDLNPLVEERHIIKPPPNATAEEYHCIWYSLTDRVQYLPGGLMSGKVSYTCCFHDLENGLQTHCYAPMGLNIKGKWTLGGSLPGEPVAPVELGLGAPLQGLWLREDVDMTCNFMMTSFVKKTLKKAHSHLVGRLLVKAQILDASMKNQALNDKLMSDGASTQPSLDYSPSDYDTQSSFGDSPSFAPYRTQSPNQTHSQLYPQPLSVRSSGTSYSGSTSTAHTSYQESTGSQRGSRVSWQNLNPVKGPAPEQNFQPYRASGQHQYAAELPSQETSKTTRPPPPLQAPPTHYAELE